MQLFCNRRFLQILSIGLLLIMSAAALPVAAQADLLTLEATESLHPALTALFVAFTGGGAQPTFVETNGALVAQRLEPASTVDMDNLPAFFLPGVALRVVQRSVEAETFLAFVVSPDGQQALIDGGFLPKTVTVTDQAGNQVEVPQPVRRVITPYSLATYYVYGVSAADRLVAAAYLGARDPSGAAAMTAIDPRFPELSKYRMSQSEINVEEIAGLKPDLLLTSARSEWLESVAVLGIPTVLFQGESPELLKEAVQITGQMLGPNAAARAAIWSAYYDSIVARVAEATKDQAEKPTVLFTGTEPLRVASGQMYQSAIIEAAGGVSVSATLTGGWNDVNLEQILVWNPSIIFVPPYGGASVEKITGSPEWATVGAVKNGRVFLFPKLSAPWDTPVPDSALGVLWMAHTLYPEQVAFDCPAEMRQFYQKFYGYAVIDLEVKVLCGS